ncbi:MAG: hypothetical protein IT377_20515 [Polyangiaceae bacterium]|nr:hypothetical protein [Polyangiaceae bacterium]
MKRVLSRVLPIGGLWLVLLACSGRKSDPPPPASSAVVPPAAPNARGTLAAGKAPVPGLTAPRASDEEEDPAPEDPDSPVPVPPAAPPGDSGVTL